MKVSHLTDGRRFPKSHRPFIPQAGTGKIIWQRRRSSGPIEPLGPPIAVNILCRHALSKRRNRSSICDPIGSLASKHKPRRAAKIPEGQNEAYIPFSRLVIMRLIRHTRRFRESAYATGARLRADDRPTSSISVKNKGPWTGPS